MHTSLEHLSTGLRINRASDDAAGLGVSEKLRTQVRGSNQAMKNALDAVSLVTIAEGAMNEISATLQRMRELAVQGANDTLTSTERSYLDQEYQNLIDEVDRINSVTNFNGIKILSGGVDSSVSQDLEDKLGQMWLGGAMDRVNAAYGLTVNGPFSVNVESIDGLSNIGGYGGGSGNGISGTGSMTLDAADFTAAINSGDDNGTMPQYGGMLNAETLVTHEMTHVMQYMNGLVTPTWFAEGAAEASYGGDERVVFLMASNPGWTENDIIAAASFVNGGAISMDSTFNNSNIDYAAAYLLVMHLDATAGGGGSGVSGIYADMKNNSVSFGTALSNELGGAGNVNAWVATATSGALGAGAFGNYATTGDIAGLGGDIGTRDISGGGYPYGFTSLSITVGENLQMHIGSNASTTNDEIEVALSSCSSGALNIGESSLTSQVSAASALTTLDSAIDLLNQNRANAGTYINRFEHTINNLQISTVNQQDAETRIRDADFAEESSRFTRNQILVQSSTAMLAQSNMRPQSVLQLIS